MRLMVLAWALGAIMPAATRAWNPLNGNFNKADPHHVRLLAYNTYGQFIAVPSTDAAYNRVLSALRPDIILFAEIPSTVTSVQVMNRLNSVLPLPGGSSWQIHFGQLDGTRCALCARYPLTMRRTNTSPTAGTRGVTIALADLPGLYHVDLYLLGVHLKCCNDPGADQDRQRSADAIAAWMGDARLPGGNITLPANTPMIVLGDFNLVGGPQPGITLLTGDIVDNATFGPDVKGDWDNSDLTDPQPVNPFTGNRNTFPSTTSPTSRLDRFIYTDSVVAVANSLVLNTLTMNSAALSAAGLLSTDTAAANTSDHLPIIMDLAVPHQPDCNNNFINDLTDIGNGTSQDCNANNVPDECEPDSDGDGRINACDNCPNLPNPDQADLNGNGVGDACEPPFVTACVSRKMHGSVPFDANMLQGLAGRSHGIEGRNNGITQLIVTFSRPVAGVGGLDPDDVLTTEGFLSSLSITGHQLTIGLEGIPDRRILLVAFPGIADAANPAQTVTQTLCMGILRGDVNGDGWVNIFDLVPTRNVLSQAVGPANFRSDINHDGAINVLDLVTIRNSLGLGIGTCP